MVQAMVGVSGSVIASSRLRHFGELSQWITYYWGERERFRVDLAVRSLFDCDS